MRKLLFVIESLHHGGAEKSLITLLNTVNLGDFEVDLILFKKGGEFENHLPKNINVIYKKPIKFSFYSRLTYWIKKKKNKYHTAQSFWKVFKNKITSNSKEYNIAIAYNQGFSTYYVASKVKAKTKFTWLNTDYINAGYNANFDKTFYENYTKIIAVSKESKTSLLKAHGSLKPEIIIVKDIINSINIKEKAIEEKNVLNKNKNIINILTVGRLAKAKGLHLAIKACQILIKKNKTIKWYIIGEGSERSKLQNLINSLKLNDNIILMGYKENPYSYMKTCDIYVQTSLFEGLGLTVIEATILNKPIVCTNFPTASSIIKHNETGLICEMTAKSIANSIIKYIDNPTFVKKVTANLQNQVNNDTELSLQKINDLLSQ